MLYNFYLTQFSISAIIKNIFGRRPYTLNSNIQAIYRPQRLHIYWNFTLSFMNKTVFFKKSDKKVYGRLPFYTSTPVFLKLIWPRALFSGKKILSSPPSQNLSLHSHIVVMKLLNRNFSNYLLKSTVVRFTVQTKEYNNE